jgi:hypothetical protein
LWQPSKAWRQIKNPGETFMDVAIGGPEELNFIRLERAVLCANCEVISNETYDGCCSACGSRALMSVSRLLGGTIFQEKTMSKGTKQNTSGDFPLPMDIELIPCAN